MKQVCGEKRTYEEPRLLIGGVEFVDDGGWACAVGDCCLDCGRGAVGGGGDGGRAVEMGITLAGDVSVGHGWGEGGQKSFRRWRCDIYNGPQGSLGCHSNVISVSKQPRAFPGLFPPRSHLSRANRGSISEPPRSDSIGGPVRVSGHPNRPHGPTPLGPICGEPTF